MRAIIDTLANLRARHGRWALAAPREACVTQRCAPATRAHERSHERPHTPPLSVLLQDIERQRSDAQALERFRKRQSCDPQPLVREATARGAVPDALWLQIPDGHFYEFSWGFVRECACPDGLTLWDFFARQAWQEPGIPECWDRFAQAHHLLVAPEIRKSLAPAAWPPVGFVDGSLHHCCATYGCHDPDDLLTARLWLSERFIPALWPLMMDHALREPGALGPHGGICAERMPA